MPTFYDRFRECAQRWPENVALEIQRTDRIESCTYGETRRMAESLGRWLVESGLQPGTRCAILASNHPRWVAVYLGIIAGGCTTVPLDTALHADQIGKLLKDSGASLLFCDAKHLPIAQEALALQEPGESRGDGRPRPSSREAAPEIPPEAPIQLVLTEPSQSPAQAGLTTLDAIYAAGPGKFTPVAVSNDDLASLIYTSGTTADPKGVMLTHANILGEVEAVFGWANIGPEDALLGVLPLFHVLSQMANLLLPLVKGSRVVYLETLNTTELLRALGERKITAFAVVPQFFYLIHERIFKEAAKHGRLTQTALPALMNLNAALRKLGLNAGPIFFKKIHQTFGDRMRYLVTGGSRFDPQIARDFAALGIDILQAYGLTETAAAAFATSHQNNVIGSVGKALKGVEGKIIGPQPQEEGPAIGEIAIRGAIVMKGYWNRPDATAAVLKDGWLHTGDLGYLDARANLFITGRQKEVIILSNGKNVYPEEIEAHYLQSSYIKEIAVMGLEARPGDPTSEQLYAVVVPNFDVLKERKIVNAKEVIRFDIEGLSAQLASTKRIGGYEIWQDPLPRTTTRKLKRFEIEKQVRADAATKQAGNAEVPAERPLTAEDTAWLEQPDVQRALKIIRDSAPAAPEIIHPGDNLDLDLGLDSMQRVELLVAIEQELGGDLEESRLSEIYTVRELVDAVRESASTGRAAPRAQFAGWKAVLEEPPTDPEVLDLVRPKPLQVAFWFMLSRLFQVFATDRFHLRVSGLEKLPSAGAYIISSNHQSYLDPVILGAILPWKVFGRTFSVGTSEIFAAGIMRWLAGRLRIVVVDPDANLVPAIRAASFGLRHGNVLILYPEGERSIDGSPRIFKKGAAILAIHSHVPIVPVAIEGFYESWPRGKPFQKFAPLSIAFGDPIQPPPEAEASEATYEKLTSDVKSRIVEMWKELRQSQIEPPSSGIHFSETL